MLPIIPTQIRLPLCQRFLGPDLKLGPGHRARLDPGEIPFIDAAVGVPNGILPELGKETLYIPQDPRRRAGCGKGFPYPDGRGTVKAETAAKNMGIEETQPRCPYSCAGG